LSNDAVRNPVLLGASAVSGYTLTVTDLVTLLEEEAVLNVDVLAVPVLVVSEDQEICSGQQAELTASGAFSYTWDNALSEASSHLVSPSSSTVYTVTGKGENNCSSTASIEITVNETPARPAVSFTGSNKICQGESVTLTTTEIEGYTYIWNNGELGNSLTVSETGNYSVIAKHSNNCESTPSVAQSITVNSRPEAPVISASGDLEFCSGGSVVLSVEPAAAYLWSNGATTQEVTVSQSTVLSVSVANEHLCYSAASEAVAIAANTIPAPPVLNISGEHLICQGQSLRISTPQVSDFTYTWSNGAEGRILNVEQAGEYTVIAESAKGCESPASAAVTLIVAELPEAPQISFTGDTLSCQAKPVVLSSLQNVEWSNGVQAELITVFQSGDFSARIRNSQNCYSDWSDTASVTIAPAFAVSVEAPSAVCVGQQVLVQASGADTYLWSNTETSSSIGFVASENIELSLIAYDEFLCSIEKDISITVSDIPVLELSAPSQACAGQLVTVRSSIPATIWEDGEVATSRSFILLADTIIKATYSNGICSTESEITVHAMPAPVFSLGADIELCAGSSHTLTAAVEGAEVVWNTGQTGNSIIVDKGGFYSATASQGACTATESVYVNIIAKPAVSVVVTDSECGNASGTASVAMPESDGYSFSWISVPAHNISNAEGQSSLNLTGLAAGSYTLLATNGICNVEALATISDIMPEGVFESLTASAASVCKGDASILSVTGTADEFIWSPMASLQFNQDGTVSAAPEQTTLYTVVAKYGDCSSAKTITINVDELPVVSVSDKLLCAGGSVQLALNGFDTYLWSNGQSGPGFSTSVPGNYSLALSKGACSAVENFTVASHIFPEYSFVVEEPACGEANGSIEVVSANNLQVIWNVGTSGSKLPAISSGIYELSLTDGVCSITDIVSLSDAIAEGVYQISYSPEVPLAGRDVKVSVSGQPESVEWIVASPYKNLATDTISLAAYSSLNVSAKIEDNSCLAYATINIPVSNTFAIEITGDAEICNGQHTVLQASQSDSYVWNTGATTQSIKVSEAGEYSVTATIGLAEAEASFTLAVSESPSLSYAFVAATCGHADGALVIIDSESDIVYTLNGTAAQQDTISNLEAGVYTLAADNGYCVSSIAALVPAKGSIDAEIEIAEAAYCGGGQFVLQASSSEATQWYASSGTLLGEGAELDVYIAESTEITAVDLSGECMATSSVSIEIIGLPVSSLQPVYEICSGQSAQLVAGKSAYSYLWSSGQETSSIAADSAGIYSVTISNGECSTVAAATVVETSTPDFRSTVINADCGFSNGSIELSATGNYVYVWEGGKLGPILHTISAGVYKLDAYNGLCKVSRNIIVGSQGAASITVSPAAASVCMGGDITYIAQGADSFKWKNASGNLLSDKSSLSILDAKADMTITVEGISNGCNSFAVVSLSVKPLPEVSVALPELVCFGAADIQQSVVPAGGLLKLGGTVVSSVSASGLSQGPHTVSYTYTSAETGCSNTAEAVLEVDAPIELSLSGLADEYCQGTSLSLLPTPESAAILINGQPAAQFNIDALRHGELLQAKLSYTRPSSGCSAELDYTSKYSKKPTVSFDYYIEGLAVRFVSQANFADELIWSFGDGSSSDAANPSHTFNNAGIHGVNLTAKNSACTSVKVAQNVVIAEVSAPSASLGLLVSPNPASGSTLLSINAELISVSATSASGLTAMLAAQPLAPGKYLIDISPLASGLYLLSVDTSLGKALVSLAVE
jgi:PKD repeat protein